MRIPLCTTFLVTLFILTACGGGGGTTATGGGNPPPTTADVQGLWTGTYTVPGDASVTIYAAITKDDHAFFYDTKGILYVLPKLTGSTSFSGTLTSYAPVGLQFEDGSTRQTFHLTGTASDTAMAGSFTGNGITASFTLHPYKPFTGTPSVVAGNWQGYYVGSHSVAVALTAQSGGALAGNDSDGCSLSGLIHHVQGEDLFEVSLTSTGGPLCYGTMTGLGFESSTDADSLFGHAAGTYYYVGVSNSKGGFIAALQVQ